MSGGSSDSISLGSRWLSKAGALVRVRLSAIQWLIMCGAALVVAIALGWWFGTVLDSWFGTGPWLTRLFTAFGLVAGVLNVYRTLSRAMKPGA